MLGAIILAVVILVVIPVSVMLTGAVVSAILGWALKDNGETTTRAASSSTSTSRHPGASTSRGRRGLGEIEAMGATDGTHRPSPAERHRWPRGGPGGSAPRAGALVGWRRQPWAAQ
jgi:hypothetical protein